MNAKRKLTWILAFAAVVVVLPVVWTLAQAQTGDGSGSQSPAEAPRFTNDVPRTPPSAEQVEEQLNTAATGSAFLVLPPAAFSSDGDIPNGFFISPNQGYFFGRVDFGACVVAPVQLPAGVTISSFEVRLKDSNSNAYEWFSLYRTDLETGTSQEIATVTSPSGVTWGMAVFVDDTITYPVVSDMYAYSIHTCTRPSIYVYSVRIGYGSTVYMPVVPNSSP
ncbi:MAG: hypothetical protein PVF47_16620 [Anaerolineae bacterium]|jgi:hypothetical protein